MYLPNDKHHLPRTRTRKDRPPATVIGSTRDIHDETWWVRERRPTPHGFWVELGWIDGNVPGPGIKSGTATIILTPALASYLQQTPDFREVDLPICSAKVSHLRTALGMDSHAQRQRWWKEREQDLHGMQLRDFASLHGISQTAVYTNFHARQWRKNKRAGWWKEPSIAQQLLTLPGREAAEQFGIKIETVYGYRRELRRLRNL